MFAFVDQMTSAENANFWILLLPSIGGFIAAVGACFWAFAGYITAQRGKIQSELDAVQSKYAAHDIAKNTIKLDQVVLQTDGRIESLIEDNRKLNASLVAVYQALGIMKGQEKERGMQNIVVRDAAVLAKGLVDRAATDAAEVLNKAQRLGPDPSTQTNAGDTSTPIQ
jgi:hypothetical protein